MQDLKMKDICNCDVEDKELLALFREKLKRWKTCLSDEKDCHSIENQLTNLFWDNSVYRTFNEARRLSKETNDPSTGLQGTIIDLLDRNFMDSQAIAIRRLTDVSSRNPDKEVYSLRRLIDEIRENANLYTRENYVCYDGISFDEAPGDDHHVRYSRCSRQTRYDYLSRKDRGSRSRDDKMSLTVFDAMKKEIEKDFEITKEVRIYVNKWVAHAAATQNRKKHVQILDNISLHKLDECYQALMRIGNKIELLIDEFLLCSVATPVFDQLKNWDKPVVIEEDLKALREYWNKR
ncbi:hypothetical protein MUP42_01660, partial [Candidatus Bathyarchaeota archaeon]|nr:hypothetical protein [Candidatus Bathyarchaeota archaeon]